MPQRLTQTAKQRLDAIPSQQQILAGKLCELPVEELESRVEQELDDNPFLEKEDSEAEDDEFPVDDEQDDVNEDESKENEDEGENNDIDDLVDFLEDGDDDSAAYKSNKSNDNDEHYEAPIRDSRSFYDDLFSQLGLLDIDEKTRKLCEYIIGNLNGDGYLADENGPITSEAICDQLLLQYWDTSIDDVESAVGVVQRLDPAGIGARDLRECLLLQLMRKNTNDNTDVEAAITIVRDCFNDFYGHHFDKITKKTGLDEMKIEAASALIKKLNPKPGDGITSFIENNSAVIPDFVVVNYGGKLRVSMNDGNVPALKVSSDMYDEYSSMSDSKEKKEALKFIKERMDSARMFIGAMRQRRMNLAKTIEAIVSIQKDYFLTGNLIMLKPMILDDVAKRVGLDVSTISRISKSKYVRTDFGTFQLKHFFSEGVGTKGGGEVSNKEIKMILAECIDGEDKQHPLSDDDLTKILRSRYGYDIARRTVAKYREDCGIPVARLRKNL